MKLLILNYILGCVAIGLMISSAYTRGKIDQMKEDKKAIDDISAQVFHSSFGVGKCETLGHGHKGITEELLKPNNSIVLGEPKK